MHRKVSFTGYLIYLERPSALEVALLYQCLPYPKTLSHVRRKLLTSLIYLECPFALEVALLCQYLPYHETLSRVQRNSKIKITSPIMQLKTD